MPRYRSKPREIDAVRWDGLNEAAVQKLAPDANVQRKDFDADGLPMLRVETLNGNVQVRVGDYVMRDEAGALYPCDPEVFTARYEEVGDE